MLLLWAATYVLCLCLLLTICFQFCINTVFKKRKKKRRVERWPRLPATRPRRYLLLPAPTNPPCCRPLPLPPTPMATSRCRARRSPARSASSSPPPSSSPSSSDCLSCSNPPRSTGRRCPLMQSATCPAASNLTPPPSPAVSMRSSSAPALAPLLPPLPITWSRQSRPSPKVSSPLLLPGTYPYQSLSSRKVAAPAAALLVRPGNVAL